KQNLKRNHAKTKHLARLHPKRKYQKRKYQKRKYQKRNHPKRNHPKRNHPKRKHLAWLHLNCNRDPASYGKGRRFPAGETAEAFETENIPWTKGDPHDWPWWTYPLPNGGAIMAEKKTQRTDRRRSAPISYYLVEIPVQQEKDGAAVTLYQHKL
ncbi:hypothetical protein KXV63_008694, partial [Aspergillus fumigatus]